MSTADPVSEFIDLIKQDVPNVESADELLAIGALIVHVLAPQAQDTV